GAHARRTPAGRRVGQLSKRVDLPRLEAGDLIATDVGHEAEMIVALPALLASFSPRADAAMLDRQGVRLLPLDLLEEALPKVTEIGVVIAVEKAFLGPRAEHDVHPLGHGTLDPGDLLAVGAELEQEVRLGVAGKLGVGDLVAPFSQAGRAIDPL